NALPLRRRLRGAGRGAALGWDPEAPRPMRPPPLLLALACAALPAPARAGARSPRADGSVVVIRGSSVSVERPPTPERVVDGSAWVEVVRPRPAPPPPAPPPPPAVVVAVAPAPDEPVFTSAFAWGWPWPPAFPKHRPPPRRLAPPP